MGQALKTSIEDKHWDKHWGQALGQALPSAADLSVRGQHLTCQCVRRCGVRWRQLAEAEAGLLARERALAEAREEMAREADRLGRLAGALHGGRKGQVTCLGSRAFMSRAQGWGPSKSNDSHARATAIVMTEGVRAAVQAGCKGCSLDPCQWHASLEQAGSKGLSTHA